MTECVICKKIKNNQPFDYTFVSMSVLCKKCKDNKIKHLIKYEEYRNNYCHGGC